MKKILFILSFCMLVVMASAEEVKMALLQPLTTPGSTACNPMEISMVRGELRKAFGWQSDFQVLTRLDVDAMLKEQGFQRSGMVDDNQRKQVGIMTGAQYICVSSITKYGTQLYIESYLVDVETGQMTNPASQYINVKDEDYSTLPAACGELAKEMLGEIGGGKRKSSGVVAGIGKKIPDGYVDLGLPSGTLWKAENEDCGLITYDQAYNFYGNSLPTKEQLQELKDHCLWTLQGNGYKVKGKNGESIFLPASGYRECDGSMWNYWIGRYWSSTLDDSELAWCLDLFSNGVVMSYGKRCGGQSVRLVRKFTN
ncbi:MAG: hypothetical protein J6P74_05950 [Paludibacteraceae bacterium]|nr:hypothetical protein [Paludibacteraceae bacterium]